MNLYKHQHEGVEFLTRRPAALLADDMGLGKTRQALVAALELFRAKKIDRVLVLAPAAVRISWVDEIVKLIDDKSPLNLVEYRASNQQFYGKSGMPVCIVSYSLLPQKRHQEALANWCFDGDTLLVCDESSFLKNRTALQTKAAAKLSRACKYRWLLTGTPIANSPLDLYGQALVMSNGNGPLKGFKNFFHFRSRYAETVPMQFGGQRAFQKIVGYKNLDELTSKFAPYVLRREKSECLDLPSKSYTTREVALTSETWKIYQELKREAMLALGDGDERPEPNAAVRILRLCQITSGHVGAMVANDVLADGELPNNTDWPVKVADISSEKLDWLVESILEGELANEQALIVWCRWRRERERLQQLLATKIEIYRIFGGQSEKNRSFDVQGFQSSTGRRVLVAQPHAGGYGLTLTAASTAVYLSNTFSFIDRVQSEDRQHRIGQTRPCLYLDVVAVGPKGQRTVDAHVLECLREKKNLAEMTCRAWRRMLADD